MMPALNKIRNTHNWVTVQLLNFEEDYTHLKSARSRDLGFGSTCKWGMHVTGLKYYKLHYRKEPDLRYWIRSLLNASYSRRAWAPTLPFIVSMAEWWSLMVPYGLEKNNVRTTVKTKHCQKEKLEFLPCSDLILK